MPFDYYQRLGAGQRATYRRSDAIARVALPDAATLAPMLEAVRVALEADNRVALGRAVTVLAASLLTQLKVPRLAVRVLARRPSSEVGELHGLYTREQDGTAVIQIWMRTAARARPIKFRTFVRTLAHELLHHLDFTLFKLDDSFHTEGFYRRESDLVRQLIGEGASARPKGQTGQKRRRQRPAREQLSLF
jgi:hypothetical protein